MFECLFIQIFNHPLYIYVCNVLDLFLLFIYVLYKCFDLYFFQTITTLLFLGFFDIFIKFNLFQPILYSCYFVVSILISIPFLDFLKIIFQTKRFLTSFQRGSFLHIHRKMFKRWYKNPIYRCFCCKDPMLCLFKDIYLSYRFEYNSKEKIVNNFWS